MTNRWSRFKARVSDAALRSYNIELPPLNPGEHVVLDAMASGPHWYYPTQGRLVLTTHRLIYYTVRHRGMPNSQLIYPRKEIQLTGIASVSMRPWVRRFWGSFPGNPVFVVTLRNGQTLTFQTARASGWVRELQGRATSERRGNDLVIT
jgi:hypothetical protein